MVPAYDLSIVVLNNHQSNPSRAARQIASWYVPEPAADTQDSPAAVDEAVKLSGGLLDEYAGTYKLGPAWYVHLSREGDQLWTQATGEDKYPMVALSDTVFIIEDYGHRTMTFFRDEGHQVSHLVYSGMVCQKMTGSPTFNQEHIADYTGDYFSDELNTLYKVVLEHGQLKLRHFRHGNIPLIPAWGDDFMGSRWFARAVEFQRDGDGKVAGFKVSQYRAKNQEFRKIDR